AWTRFRQSRHGGGVAYVTIRPLATIPRMSITGIAKQSDPDADGLRRLLGAPEIAWLVERIRGRLERGEPVDGTVTLVGATHAERRAAARQPGRAGAGRGGAGRPGRGGGGGSGRAEPGPAADPGAARAGAARGGARARRLGRGAAAVDHRGSGGRRPGQPGSRAELPGGRRA